jgi:hypothetical protein
MLLQRIVPYAGPALLALAFAAASPARAEPARVAYGYGQAAAATGPTFDLRDRLPAIQPAEIRPAQPTAEAPAPAPAPVSSGEGEAAICAAPAAEGDLSATHPAMPIGALVFVTDLDTHKEVIVRVSARGQTQLSPRAAAALDCRGRARISVQYLGPAPTNAARSAPTAYTRAAYVAPMPAARGAFMVQIGAFGERDNAERAKDRADRVGRASIERVRVSDRTLYRVRLGPWDDRADAEQARAQALRLGFSDAKITGR